MSQLDTLSSLQEIQVRFKTLLERVETNLQAWLISTIYVTSRNKRNFIVGSKV